MVDKKDCITIFDKVYYMRRGGRNKKYQSDYDGDWLMGSGKIVSIRTRDGDNVLKGECKIKNVDYVVVVPLSEDDKGDIDSVDLKVGEFTYNFQNYLENLLK